MSPSQRAWLILGGFVTVFVISYDLVAKPGQTLSEEARRHPTLTRFFCDLISGHLKGTLPIDPFSIAFGVAQQLLKRRAAQS